MFLIPNKTRQDFSGHLNLKAKKKLGEKGRSHTLEAQNGRNAFPSEFESTIDFS